MEERCNMIHSSGEDALNSRSATAEVKDTAASTSTIAVEDITASTSIIREDMVASSSTISAEDTVASTSNIVKDMAASTSTISAEDTVASTSYFVKDMAASTSTICAEDTVASTSTISAEDTVASTSSIVNDMVASTSYFVEDMASTSTSRIKVVVPHAKVQPCPPPLPIDFHEELVHSDNMQYQHASIVRQFFATQTARVLPEPEDDVDDNFPGSLILTADAALVDDCDMPISIKDELMAEAKRDENRGRKWEEVFPEYDSDETF